MQPQLLIQIIEIKKQYLKNCAPFPNCISKINNTQIDNAALYSDNFSKTSGSLWQYCKEIPAVDNAGDIVDFNGANATLHLILQQK